MEIVIRAVRQGKRGRRNGKEEMKPSSVTSDCIVHAKTTQKESTD